MLYCEDWEKKQARFLEYWAKENHDRPILLLRAPKSSEANPVRHHATMRERWMDTEYMLEKANWQMQHTAYLAEAFPALNPNLGPDFFAACYDTELEFGDTTSWAEPFLSDEDVEAFSHFIFNEQNEYYKKMLEMTAAAVEDGKDKYIVGVTDLHPGADALVSMRGPENLCYDTLDYPEFIQKGVMDLLPGFEKVYTDLYNLTTKYQKGSTCWMGVWHPGKWYPVSCDFSCMVSPDMYNSLIADEIEKETQWLDGSIYHLDGPGALKHLDRILQMPELDGVQWVYGAGQPTASHWIPVIKKIQSAGKCVHIDAVPEELDILLKELSPEGLLLNVAAANEDDACALLKMAEESYKYRK